MTSGRRKWGAVNINGSFWEFTEGDRDFMVGSRVSERSRHFILREESFQKEKEESLQYVLYDNGNAVCSFSSHLILVRLC